MSQLLPGETPRRPADRGAPARVFVSDAVELGFDLRALFGSELRLEGQDTDADYGQFAFFVAWAF